MVGRSATHADIPENLARAHVIPVTCCGSLDFKYSPICTDRSISPCAGVVGQVHARDGKTVDVQSMTAHVLVDAVFRYDQRTKEGVIAGWHAIVGFSRRHTATAFDTRPVHDPVKCKPEIKSRASTAARSEESVPERQPWIDIADFEREITTVVAKGRVV
jgi:hypothetical protein